MQSALARLPAAVEEASWSLVVAALARAVLVRSASPAARWGARRLGVAAAEGAASRKAYKLGRALCSAGCLLSLLGTAAAALRTAGPAARCQADPDPQTPAVVAAAALVVFCSTARFRVSLWAILALRAAAEREGGGLVWLLLAKTIAVYFGSHSAFVSALLVPACTAHFSLCRSSSSGAALLLALSSASFTLCARTARWVARSKRA